jgi:hypothetical protein
MLKIKRRIEITAFRRRRLAGSAAEPSVQPSTTAVDESLVEEIAALIKQLAGDSLGSIRVRQAFNRAEEDSEREIE